jgi:Rieske Fe-S protein
MGRMSRDPASKEDPRRAFLKKVTGGLGAVVGAAVVAPGVGLLVHPAREDTLSGGDEPLDVGRKAADLKPGEPVMAEVRGEVRDAWMRLPDVKLGACWLVRTAEAGPVRAYSTVCPHLGCGIDFDGGKKQFVCPCHDSYFDLEGKVLTGPSPRAMDELDIVSGADGRLKVAYRRFRLGIPKKENV